MARLFEARTNQLAVESASGTLKRLYWAERELLRATGARHPSVANWEAKKALPRHIWEDTLHADGLRTRVLELRYPRRDVDQEPPAALVQAIHQVVSAENDAETLAAVYGVFKPALIDAYERYLDQTDPVDDAPTIYHLQRVVQEKRAQVAEGLSLIEGLAERPDTSAWTAYLRDCLAAAGGMLGEGEVGPPPKRAPYSARPGYVRPRRFARDPRFLPANIHMPNRPADPNHPLEVQVWSAINHINEMWAAEVPLMLAWELGEMPWNFYLDVGRWAWDEARHSIMGERRLLAWGFETGVDFPMVADHYHAVADEPPALIFALLNSFESGGPAWKKGMKATFEALGDAASAQDCDYDWADEAIHLTYGFRWLRHLVGDEDEIEALKSRARQRWNEWREAAKREPLGDYEPFGSRIAAKIRAMEEAK